MALSNALAAALRDALAAPPPFVRSIGTDADGTLWDCDVGDVLFLEVARRDDFRGAGLAALRAYGQRLLGPAAPTAPAELARALFAEYAADRVDIATMCELEAVTVGDRAEAEFDELVAAVAEASALKARPDVRELLFAAREAGAPVHVVTGSLAVIVEATLRRAGLPHDSVTGAVLRRGAGRVLAEIETPAPLFEGKVAALRSAGAWPAAMGLGDGGWDRTFLREVYLPVLVYPKPALAEAMAGVPRAVTLG